jgi:hypothetical protein
MNDTPRLSADQCLAIAEYLLKTAETQARGRWFAELAKTAERGDWPSSCTAPFQLLTKEESAAIWMASPALRQRVFAPYLTKTELEALRRRATQGAEFGRKASADLPPKSDDDKPMG